MQISDPILQWLLSARARETRRNEGQPETEENALSSYQLAIPKMAVRVYHFEQECVCECVHLCVCLRMSKSL